MICAAFFVLAAVSRAELVGGRFRSAGEPYAFAFPRDHAAHPDYRTEWWYYTGHLVARDGRRFGYELTFFRVGLRPGDPAPRPGQSRWRGHQVFLAHLAVTDVAGHRFLYAERFEREALGMGSAASDRLDVRVDDWTLRGELEAGRAQERMSLHAREGAGSETFGVDLTQSSQKPPAIHGHNGISRKGACASCASHYYSYTRLQTKGVLTYEGTPLAVGGVSWMDHEFASSQLESNQSGWDWFALQLDDGRELMFYRLRETGGATSPQSSGSLIEQNGHVRFLRLAEVDVRSLSTWSSPHTGATYPSGWRLRVPSSPLDVTLVPAVADQELADPSGTSYWEGAVDVLRDGARIGVGYVELTGYAAFLRF